MGFKLENISIKSRDEMNKILGQYIKKIIEDQIRDIMFDGSIKLVKTERENMAMPQVIIQWYYNPYTNKCFFEFYMSSGMEKLVHTDKLLNRLKRRVDINFKYDTNVWPEIITPEDGSNERCDSNVSITPYTIGYWKSLAGQYQFIEDNIQVLADAGNYIINDDYGHEGEEKFQLFIDDCEKIEKKYRQTYLTPDQKNSYLSEVNTIASKYKRDSAEYKTAINNLNNKYGIKTNISNQIPTIFTEYKKLYKTYFDQDLDDVYKNTQIMYTNAYIPKKDQIMFISGGY